MREKAKSMAEIKNCVQATETMMRFIDESVEQARIFTRYNYDILSFVGGIWDDDRIDEKLAGTIEKVVSDLKESVADFELTIKGDDWGVIECFVCGCLDTPRYDEAKMTYDIPDGWDKIAGKNLCDECLEETEEIEAMLAKAEQEAILRLESLKKHRQAPDIDCASRPYTTRVGDDFREIPEHEEVGVMHLKLIGQETTPEGTILIFEKDGDEILHAKTWSAYLGDLFGMEKSDIEDFATWVARQDFPADLDATYYYDLKEVVADFLEEAGRD